MSEIDIRRENWRLNMFASRQVTRVETPSDPRYEYHYDQIAPIYAQVSSNILMIGTASNSAKPYWFLGAFVSRFLYISPSTSGQFIAGVQAEETRKVGLSRLTLLEFKPYSLDSYLLAIEPPYWLEDIYVEVWEYVGQIIDDADILEIKQRLERIEFKVDNLNI